MCRVWPQRMVMVAQTWEDRNLLAISSALPTPWPREVLTKRSHVIRSRCLEICQPRLNHHAQFFIFTMRWTVQLIDSINSFIDSYFVYPFQGLNLFKMPGSTLFLAPPSWEAGPRLLETVLACHTSVSLRDIRVSSLMLELDSLSIFPTRSRKFQGLLSL